MRTSRLAVLLLLPYVALDFGNPLMPGAVSFDPDECVEAVRAARITSAAVAAASAPVPPRLRSVRLERSTPTRVSGSVVSFERVTLVRRTPERSTAPAPASEDH